MRYHIKEKRWSLTEAFVIRDDANKPVYEIHGKFFHVGDNLIMRDRHTHEELGHIKQHVVHILPHYEVHRKGQSLAHIRGQEKLFGEFLKIEGADGGTYHVAGDILQWNFSLSDSKGNLLAQVGRQFSSDAESYGIDTSQGTDDPAIIAMVVAIDMIREHHAPKQDRDK